MLSAECWSWSWRILPLPQQQPLWSKLRPNERGVCLTEDIKKEDVKEDEVAQTTEEVVEESNQPSELEEAQARAEEFENKYLRAHAEMQNIQRRANEERQQLQKYRSQDLAKAILPSLATSNVPLPSKG